MLLILQSALFSPCTPMKVNANSSFFQKYFSCNAHCTKNEVFHKESLMESFIFLCTVKVSLG